MIFLILRAKTEPNLPTTRDLPKPVKIEVKLGGIHKRIIIIIIRLDDLCRQVNSTLLLMECWVFFVKIVNVAIKEFDLII